MLIQNILYRTDQNKRQDAGDLDRQILSDLRDLRDRLKAYQTGHLDAKVKDKSNHYEQWTEENNKKLAWVNRLIELAEKGLTWNPVTSTPEKFEQASWDELHPKFREPLVLAMAIREVAKIGAYDFDTVYVEKQSFHPEDWYLWSVAACRTYEDAPAQWSCWTMNLTTGGLNGGHYGLSCQDLKKILAQKKSIAVCDPDDCDLRKEG